MPVLEPIVQYLLNIAATAFLVAVFLVAFDIYHDSTEYVLTPDDADTVTANYVYVVVVKFQSSGNQDTYVVKGGPDVTEDDVRGAVQALIPGTKVLQVERERLYAAHTHHETV